MHCRIAAVAKDTVRRIARSGALACVAVFVFLATVVISFFAEGGGSLAGETVVALRYPLGFAGIVLSGSTLWMSCAAVSREMNRKTAELIAVKPVARLEIWLGKWIGVNAVSFLILLLAFGTVYIGVTLRTHLYDSDPGQLREVRTEVLTARTAFSPVNTDFRSRAAEEVTRMRESGDFPAEADLDSLTEKITRRMRFGFYTVRPGHSRSWIFEVPKRIVQTNLGQWTVDFTFRTPGMQRLNAAGTWALGPAAEPYADIYQMHNYISGRYSFDIPPQAFSDAVNAPLKGNLEIPLTYSNAPPSESSTVVFDPESGITLLTKTGSFEGNLLRAFIIMLSHLAVIAALGLTAGICFSFPVAAFVGACTIIVVFLGDYFVGASDMPVHEHHGGQPVESGALESFGAFFAEKLVIVVEPLTRFDILARLADGRMVTVQATIEAFVLLGIIIPALLLAPGVLVMARREFK